jgi:anaphase-promoting complex subunit 1
MIELNLKPPISQPAQRPDIVGWIQTCLLGNRATYYRTPADIFYASARLPEADKRFDSRWDALIPRITMFRQFFKLVRPTSSAVEIVEALRDSGMTPHILQTLPEALLVPLQDAISICQPHPPSTWSKDLLELVKRSDISYIIAPNERPRAAMTSILVRLLITFIVNLLTS